MKLRRLAALIGFIQELSSFRDSAPNANATTSGTPDMCRYDDESYSVSDIDSDLDPVDDVVC
ncbi:hypothetical protein AZE42_07423 [Rhizopogon vesiculosus]|uniref:Uncharacterized protein n=1 Tax=Rhizopogon vesiculosus TaxID=180088 RepID=A0A1J8QG11_9AGAM|nr:hypothetical protein AZE42_07423 [Rhizopogon vesiculosus]